MEPNAVYTAYAQDGIGDHQGDGLYSVVITASAFNGKFISNGYARFTEVGGGVNPPKIFKLPSSLGPGLRFKNIFVDHRAGRGKTILVAGLQVGTPPELEAAMSAGCALLPRPRHFARDRNRTSPSLVPFSVGLALAVPHPPPHVREGKATRTARA